MSKGKSIFEVEVHLTDPLKSNMWHYKFDPHSLIDVPEVPLAELKPIPTTFNGVAVKGESVKDFLDKSNIMKNQKSLI
jgi:hypothetical protein